MPSPLARRERTSQAESCVVLYDASGRRVPEQGEQSALSEQAPARLAQALRVADLVASLPAVQLWRYLDGTITGYLLVSSAGLPGNYRAVLILQQGNEHSWRLLDNLPIAIFILDEDYRASDMNYRVSAFLGTPVEDLLGSGWHHIFSPDHLADLQAHFSHRDTGSFPFKAVWQISKPAGIERNFAVTVVRRWFGHGVEGGYLMSLIDVGSEVRARRNLERLAGEDPLTHCLNRRSFVEVLRGLSAHELETLAVAFIDLDRFKGINDTYGHEAGDQVLRAAAARLRATVRGGDWIARFGGDEFAVAVPGISGHQALEGLAEKLHYAMNGQVRYGDTLIPLRCSIGVVNGASCLDVLQDTAPDSRLDQLLRMADAAMYDAKVRSGGGVFRLYDARVEQALHNERRCLAEFETRSDPDNLWFAFQPIYRGEQVVAVEALLRLHQPLEVHDTLEHFIDTARCSRRAADFLDGLTARQIAAYGEAKQAFACLRDIDLQVNVDVEQLARARFVDELLRWCGDAGLAPRSVMVELTELALESASDAVLSSAQTLRARGFRVSMDDFGEGFSSLKRLAQYEFDQLKLDRYFVVNALESDRFRALVDGMIGLGRALDVPMVAEGIETAEECAFFTDRGVELVQGYFRAKPLPIPEVADLICQQAGTA